MIKISCPGCRGFDWNNANADTMFLHQQGKNGKEIIPEKASNEIGAYGRKCLICGQWEKARWQMDNKGDCHFTEICNCKSPNWPEDKGCPYCDGTGEISLLKHYYARGEHKKIKRLKKFIKILQDFKRNKLQNLST